MVRSNRFFFLILFVLLLGCNSKNGENDRNRLAEMEEYSYMFSMESVGNYKVDLQLNTDSTYQIEQYNYFFDRHARTNTPNIRQGKLTSEEFVKIDKLIRESDLYNMDDSYGFEDNSDNSIIYIIKLQEGDVPKYVSINAGSNHRFTKEFTELIEFTTEFINSKLVD